MLIKTRYIGATDTKPARISAVMVGGGFINSRLIQAWDDEFSAPGNHILACRALVSMLYENCEYIPRFVGGWSAGAESGTCYWVREDSHLKA